MHGFIYSFILYIYKGTYYVSRIVPSATDAEVVYERDKVFLLSWSLHSKVGRQPKKDRHLVE